MNLIDMELTTNIDEALDKANNNCGIPHQNFVVGDTTGKIAWDRSWSHSASVRTRGRLPQSWADGKMGWNGFLNPDEYRASLIQPVDGFGPPTPEW